MNESRNTIWGGFSLAALPVAAAQTPASVAAGPERDQVLAEVVAGSKSLLEIVFSGGIPGILIVLVLLTLSLALVALIVEHMATLRAAVLLPAGLGDDVRRQLLQGNLQAAEQACRARPCCLAFVLRAGLAEVSGGWTAVEKALEDATAEQAARLLRKVEYLSVLGTIAPMVGLLGTVLGMILAFQEVATSAGAARAAMLAEGIYQALITTVGGLLVAIPALGAFAVFRNRVDGLIAEVAYAARHAVGPLKHARVRRSQSPVTDTAQEEV